MILGASLIIIVELLNNSYINDKMSANVYSSLKANIHACLVSQGWRTDYL